MTDEFVKLFEGLDAPRPLPADVRGRVEQRLLEPTLPDALASVDAPRELPEALRGRLEAALISGAGPRALPAPFRRRLERSLRRPAAVRTAGLVAAALLLLLGSVTLVTRDGASPPRSVATGGQATDGSVSDGFGSDSVSGGSVEAFGPATSAGAAAVGGASGGANSGPNAAGSSAAGAVAIAVIGGDPDEEAGFRAYVGRQNQTGGPRFNVVDAAASSIVTVNLSGQPVTPPSGRVFMDGLSAREAELRGSVFDIASVVERQAHIAATTAFPTSAPRARAIIYTADEEPFATRVPAAIEEALRDRGVAAIRIRYGGSGTPLLPRADAVFLSLPTDSVRSWLRAARVADYTPDRGTWGLYSAADESLVADMTSSVHVVSPFAFPTSDEAADLRKSTGRALSARLIQGWLTAEFVAEAVRRSGAETAGELTAALSNMTGYVDGFAPAYEVRPGTNSRTPEGIVLLPSGTSFNSQGDFVRDRR